MEFLVHEYSQLLTFIGVGLLAQMVDGGIGMGYGIFSNSVLLSLGIPPSISSGAVHTAEVFTTGFSSFFHWKEKNVERKLFFHLLIPGIFGALIGSVILIFFYSSVIKPIITGYLFILGFLILRKSFHKIQEENAYHFFPFRILHHLTVKLSKVIFPYGESIPAIFIKFLGIIAGILDAIGGGGWGPVTTSTLIAKDHNPRYTIGTVNAVEFFVTLTTSLSILFAFGLDGWQIIVGLLIGGLIASPISAKICRYIQPRFLMLIVGILIILMSGWNFGLWIMQ